VATGGNQSPATQSRQQDKAAPGAQQTANKPGGKAYSRAGKGLIGTIHKQSRLSAILMLVCTPKKNLSQKKGEKRMTVNELLSAAAALFFAGSDAAQAAVPLLGAALVIALLGIWILIKKEDVHGA
jgi:hypothetical protein